MIKAAQIVLLTLLAGGFMSSGCYKAPPPQKQLPIASGDIVRCVLHEGVLSAGRPSTNSQTFTEGKVEIYDNGVVIITERDGTKHGAGTLFFSELTFR